MSNTHSGTGCHPHLLRTDGATMEPMESAPRRVLFVHAHPDDETLVTGGTIATLVARGDDVTVVTATRGERGEVIPQSLKYLEADPAALAAAREAELAQAMGQLGVTDHRWLGGPGARRAGSSLHSYSDSGMRWARPGVAAAAADAPANALSLSDEQQVADDLQAVIQQVRPQAIVTYNDFGGYGHPDHVAVHRAAARAFADAWRDDQAWHPTALFAVERTRAQAKADARVIRERTDFTPLPGGRRVTVASRDIDTTIDVRGTRDRVRRAMQCYRTQLTLEGDCYALSNHTGAPIASAERYIEIGGHAQPVDAAAAHDLIDGWQPARTRPAPTGWRATARQWLTPVALVAFGAIVALITTMSHGATWYPTGEATPAIPYGLIVSAVALLVGTLAVRVELPGRWSGAWFALGASVMLYVLASPRASGSILLYPKTIDYLWLYGGIIALILLAFVPLPRAWHD